MTKILYIPTGEFVIFYTCFSGGATTTYEETAYHNVKHLSPQEFIDKQIVQYFKEGNGSNVTPLEFTVVTI
jgi:hypothetical protein